MSQALLIFKPDASHRLACRAGCWRWLSDNPKVEVKSLQWFQASPELIKQHYGFLAGRPFYPWLIDFMTALPLLVGRLEAESGDLNGLRDALGETMVQLARPASLRQRFGIFGGINCLHVSDSVESGEHEVDLWSQHLDMSVGIKDSPGLTVQDPDHTFQLRCLAYQVSSSIHAETAGAEMRRLLRQETDLDDAGFESLWRVVHTAIAPQ